MTTRDGWTLHLEEHPPRSPGGSARARAALVLSPGMMLGRRAMDRPSGRGLASHLAGRGHHVYTLDLRGHGASGPKAGEGADWTYDDLVLHDIPAAVGAVARRHPDLPLAWVGHSLSAHAGAATLGLRRDLPLDAAVLISPVVWMRRHEPSAAWWLYKRLVLALWHGLTRAVGHTPARRLGIGTDDEAAGYVAQFPRWARQDRWRSREDLPGGPLDYLEGLGRVELPVLVMNARGDRWISRTPCVRRFAAEMVRARLTFLELGRRELGGDTEPGHMALLTDPRSRPAWERIADWLDRVLPRAVRS